jgi:hypothetical protein
VEPDLHRLLGDGLSGVAHLVAVAAGAHLVTGAPPVEYSASR